MKNLPSFLFTIVFVLLTVVAYDQLWSKKKLAYVKTGTLLEKYEGIVSASKELENNTKTIQANVDTLKNRVLSLQEKYRKDKSVYGKLSVAEKEYSSYSTTAGQEIGKLRAELLKKNVDKINAFIKEYGKKHAYAYILGATENGNILYAPDGDDITEEVLEGLNREYKATSK